VATGKLPSSTVVRLPGGPLEARPDLTLAEWALLSRVDGRRPLSALAGRSGRGHGEATALAERLIAVGVLELVGAPDAPTTAAEVEPADQSEVAATAVPGSAGQPGGGEEGGDEAQAPGQASIDPVSLLRELAADAAEAPSAAGEPEERDGQDLAELAARLGGGVGKDQAGPEVQEDREAGDGPARAPGRGADQAEFLREFASLAMGAAAADDPEPTSQPEEEPSDDERGRGRLGFRRGQRR